MNLDERFIEEKLSLSVLNKLSAKESGFIRVPKIHNIHTWFARRPAGAGRALTLASVLPKTFDENTFNQISSLTEAEKSGKVIYMVNPNRKAVEDKLKVTVRKTPCDLVVSDPMAGGGSIPLEAARLGFRTVAVEYNPVAYLILKASVEFPARYADAGLFEETLKASKEFIQKAREELGRYYGEDAENYIFARR
jgi:putative DNA methylase